MFIHSFIDSFTYERITIQNRAGRCKMENLRKTKLRTKRLTSRKYRICKPLIVLEFPRMSGKGFGRAAWYQPWERAAGGGDGR